MTTIGQTVGNYRLVAKLGEGGMGEVFRGVDLMLERSVAIKALHLELARREDLVARFREEAIILARLNHPNVATLFNFFRDGDRWFMVMEYAPGETLDRLIAEHRQGMPWQRAVGITTQCLQALEHAHSHGVIHRDLKPANIMVSAGGLVKVMDFGIARLVGGDRLTRTGHLVGTPSYMTPEQIKGRDADARSDLYSLGIVLYEMLSGQPPFRADSEYELLKAQVETLPPSLRERLPQLPTALDQGLAQVLAKQPEARFRTALDFRLALDVLSSPAMAPQPTRIVPVPTSHIQEGIPSQIGEEETQGAEFEAAWTAKKEKEQPGTIEREREVEQHASEEIIRLPEDTGRLRCDDISETSAPADAAERPDLHEMPAPSSEGLDNRTDGRQPLLTKEPKPQIRTPQARRSARFVAIGLATLASVVLATTALFLLTFREDSRIPRLIQQAQAALADGRLTDPKGDSALAYAKEVLNIYPEHAEAQRILHLSLDARLQEGLDALPEGNLQKAKQVLREVEALVASYHAVGIETGHLTDAISAEQEGRRAAKAAELKQYANAEEPKKDEKAERQAEAERIAQEEVGRGHGIEETATATEMPAPGKSAFADANRPSANSHEQTSVSSSVADGPDAKPETTPAEPKIAAIEAPQTDSLHSKQVQEWLRNGEIAFAAKRLLTPKDDAAVTWANRVLEVEPNNPDALALIGRSIDTYLDWAGSQLARWKLSSAATSIRRAASLDDYASLEQQESLEELQRQLNNKQAKASKRRPRKSRRSSSSRASVTKAPDAQAQDTSGFWGRFQKKLKAADCAIQGLVNRNSCR